MLPKIAAQFVTGVSLFLFLTVVSGKFLVAPVQAQAADAGVCADELPNPDAVLSCLETQYDGNINNFCDPSRCQCNNWAEATVYESDSIARDCENYTCGLYADSGFAHFALCFPLTAEAGEETGEACALRVDTSNNRYLVISNLNLDPGTYQARFSGVTSDGDVEELSTVSVQLDAHGTVTNTTIPDIPEEYPRAYFQVLSSGGEELCQTGADGATLDLLRTTITDEDIEEATGTTYTGSGGTPFEYCRQVPPSQRSACNTCFSRGAEGEHIFTAVGCVSVSGSGLAADLIKIMLGIGGGVALLSLLNAAFKLSISRGDTSKIKEAKELVTASVTGLLFLIFSVIIMQFVGVQIFHIPGLG
jgi:hypothetical protein